MANYSNLKAAIEAAIKTNGNQEITGQVLQDVLTSVVSVLGANYTFTGVATPATNPGTPDQNVFYFATEAGTYSNFGGISITERSLFLFLWNGTWTNIDLLNLDEYYQDLDTLVAQFEQQLRQMLEDYQPIVIEGDVTNAPDEEDLTSVDNLLRFKNRNTLYGMGCIYLRRELGFAEQLRQENTIYVIRYDYTLTADVTIPANCVLQFDGGSLNGEYTITGNNTGINAGLVKIFNTDVTLAGSWNVPEAYPEWFGAKGDGVTDDTSSIQAMFDSLLVNYILSSTYLISKVNVSGNVKGDGTITTDPDESDVYVFNVVGDFKVDGIKFNLASNETITSVKSSKIGIFVDGNYEIQIINCFFNNVTTKAVRLYGLRNKSAKICGCYFDCANGANAYVGEFIYISQCYGANSSTISNGNIYIHDNIFVGNGSNVDNMAGVFLATIKMASTRIYNNTFIKCGRNNSQNARVYVIDAYFDVVNLYVNSNVFIDSCWGVIRLHGVKNSELKDNVIDGALFNITEAAININDGASSTGLSAVGVSNIDISCNSIRPGENRFQMGIELFSTTGAIENINIHNNVMEGTLPDGAVYIGTTSKSVSIRDNKFDVSTVGIKTEDITSALELIVIGNEIIANGGSVIVQKADDVVNGIIIFNKLQSNNVNSYVLLRCANSDIKNNVIIGDRGINGAKNVGMNDISVTNTTDPVINISGNNYGNYINGVV